MRIFTLLISFIMLATFPFEYFSVSAADQTTTLPKESVNPGSMLYPFKRLLEKIQVVMVFSDNAGVNLHRKLLRKRFYELSYLVENKKITPMERASQRFSYQAGILVEAAEKNGDPQNFSDIKKDFENFSPYLESFRDNFPANSSNWLLMQQNIDTLNLLADKI